MIEKSTATELTLNGKQFVFRNQGASAKASVKSIHPPQLDPVNWIPLTYKLESYQKLVRYAYVGNSTEKISLLTNTAYTDYDSLPKEYTRKHFRFHRENSLGARRRTYEGTLNTEATSLDFKLPYEVFDINVNEIQVGSPDACD